MNYNKVSEDFEKRFGRKPEREYFIGKPITFFSCRGFSAGCCISTGGCIALSRREDERLIVHFSDNNKFINCSKSDLENNTDKKICALLIEAERYGVRIGGAEMLLHYDSEVSHPYRQLILASLGGFCTNVPPAAELCAHFENYGQNILAMCGRKDRLAVMSGGDVQYLPLPDGAVKIVLCYTDKKKYAEVHGESRIAQSALDALAGGDFEKFGAALDRYMQGVQKTNRGMQRLHRLAMQTGDAYGSGYTGDGGLFAIVPNDRVDPYIYSLSKAYREFCGGKPEFYVTRAENSGIACG